MDREKEKGVETAESELREALLETNKKDPGARASGSFVSVPAE